MFSNVLSILSAVLVFGAIIFFHELGHFLVAKKAGIRVHEFAVGMGPKLLSVTRGETKYSIRALPVGGFVMLEGEEEESNDARSLTRQPAWVQIAVYLAGALTNIFMGYVILVIVVAMTGYVGTTIVSKVDEGTAAYGILQKNDKIIRINNHKVYTSNDITYELMRDQDGLVTMDVVRDGKTLSDLSIQFKMTEIAKDIKAISLDFKVFAKPNTPWDTILYPLNWGYSIVKQVWGSLIDLIRGRYSLNHLSGPVGVTSAISTASKMGLESFLMMAALITINIGVFNLLPIPILDGGKIVIILLEQLMRRKINQPFVEKISFGSIVLLMGLMAYVTINDLFALFSK